MAKLALREITPLQMAFIRPCIACLLLLLLVGLTGRGGTLMSLLRRRPLELLGLGVFGFAGAGGLTVFALSLLPAGVTSLVSNTAPLILAVGAALFLRKLDPLPLLGAFVGFAGVALLAFSGDEVRVPESNMLLGVAIGLVSSTSWAVYMLIARRVGGEDSLATITLAGAIGAVLIGLVAVPTQDWSNLPHLSTQGFVTTIWTGAISMALPYVGWSMALRTLPATTVAPFSYLIPVIALLLANVVLGEPLTFSVLLGAAGVLGGVALSQASAWRGALLGRRRVGGTVQQR